MLVRIAIIAALIAVGPGVIQREDVLQNAGFTGYCTTIPTPAGQSGFGHECRPGKMTGTPELQGRRALARSAACSYDPTSSFRGQLKGDQLA